MSNDPLVPSNPDDFEKLIALLCQQSGYTVTMPPANTKGYDIELKNGVQCIAVQVKNHKAKCSIAQVQKFQEYLDLPIAARFSSGWFICANGFSQSALTHVETERPNNLCLGTYHNGTVVWNYPKSHEAEAAIAAATMNTAIDVQRPLKYIGVFTCKGGVGKTTVAAHLAGAFALMGHDVILVDLDPDKNLRKLFLQDPTDEDGDASLYVPPKMKGQEGATITVLNHDQWNEDHYKDTKIVICDCSPVLTENPRNLVEKFNYCIIPTTLNPLGIAKHADVITRTFKHIRQLSADAEMFAIINSYDVSKDAEKRNGVLLDHLQRHIDLYAATDSKCQLIHPDAAKIRYSVALLYWGYHIIEGSKPQLAFRETAGRSYPRTDFLQLAEYLENHTDIDKLRDIEHVIFQPRE
ncbi:AAA family ATPase [Chromatium okenii]|uniref:nucleotide-binding protein n=1 Tax=Chromatium okenii TaxID=61644 RepID=UPI0026EA436C|nr:AAA family ATPase [Chromatium okenii]MBV5311559.1 AAA family ATPase [Chromatium okenii]